MLQAPGAATAPANRIDRALVRAIALARVWAVELESGRVDSIRSLARREGLCNHYAIRLLPLAYLAPELIDEILEGHQPRNLTLSALTAEPLPLTWTGSANVSGSLQRAEEFAAGFIAAPEDRCSQPRPRA
ncbi:MAG: hypothetical protein E6R00_06675 [Gammaproteobacteria bacterium]|nr:MAG: hypothetical protein E6R00_06675 [Gammaproteobacteria bacterium]